MSANNYYKVVVVDKDGRKRTSHLFPFDAASEPVAYAAALDLRLMLADRATMSCWRRVPGRNFPEIGEPRIPDEDC